MTGDNKDLVYYRLSRAKETLDDAKILIERKKWNSAINRLYYAAYYAITALLIKQNLNQKTHNGVKISFSVHFIKPGHIDKQHGKIYSQLFTWRQKGDYDDLFDFDEEKVLPYIVPVENLILEVELLVKS